MEKIISSIKKVEVYRVKRIALLRAFNIYGKNMIIF